MYLKSIEMQGFKSFANKTILQFHDGITGVVGPNGSGKSNVGDAVRWVLGEQSAKQLRGGNMQDVIFSGTETRKPLGYASVAITLDNSDHKLNVDFEEVTVTRRLYRSGESEYLMNGASCRLKDINELFYDTGIGKEGYSIIGQGRIDEILSAKGEERRRIFEEAAGIVKYKTRKNEAVNKLEKEQQNLLRVDDIISELEVQVEPLEKQSEKAREYLRLKERLKQAEMTAFCRDAARIAKETEMLLQAEETAAEQLAESLAKSNLEKAQAAFFREKNEELDALLQQQNDKMTELRAELEKTEGEIRLREEQRANDEANRTRLATVLYNLLETIRIVTVPLSAFMPETMPKIWEQIGASEADVAYSTADQFGTLPANVTVHKGNIIFPRIDVEKEIDELNRLILAAQPKEEPQEPEFTPQPLAEEIDIDTFGKTDLRVAKVLECEKVKKSKKLLKLQLDDGMGGRQVVSGIAPWYKPEDLIGKKIVLVANLKPAKLCGVESCGMICAADMPNGDVKVIFPDESLPVGSKIR